MEYDVIAALFPGTLLLAPGPVSGLQADSSQARSSGPAHSMVCLHLCLRNMRYSLLLSTAEINCHVWCW